MKARRGPITNPDDPCSRLIPLTRGYFAIVDADVADQVAEHMWSASVWKKCRTVYAQTFSPGSRRPLKLHQFLWNLWGLSPVPQIDHENRNGLDCRRSNLRAATRSQNQHNRDKNANNSSGFKGVSRKGNRWRARLMVEWKEVVIGTFATPEEAARAYAAAAALHHGEFANPTEEFPCP